MPITITQESIKDVKNRFNLRGNSQELNDAIVRAMQVAPYDISVLVHGESGTGKETIPKIIHSLGARKHNKYVAINCGAIPEGTINSELFGHKKGAFTDADADRVGYFEDADGGTIFLDEVAEMPASTQAMLLRVLESGEFFRLGDSEVRKTNVRVVAATNKDLLSEVRAGRFRGDLYYRLAATKIELPPLRKRGIDDIRTLIMLFSTKFAQANRSPLAKFTDGAIKLFAEQEWEGNVRELKNVVEQVSLFEAGNTVDEHVAARYLNKEASTASNVPALIEHGKADYAMERAFIMGSITRLYEEVARLTSLIEGGHTAPAYVASEAMTLHREMSTLLQAPSRIEGDNTGVIERIDSQDTAQHGYVDHVEEVMQVKTLDETERDTIAEALIRNRGRRRRTAEELQISERTLYRKIRQYNLENIEDQ
ncbi:sigma 54-interacting transcriptional regulator [Sodaliphilus sp.]|uniref:sigma 54-interacting transcriptional regulator n=1 Tax=Sodaliphilus sp. TaxID=2815818 RepID=UPI00388DDE1D